MRLENQNFSYKIVSKRKPKSTQEPILLIHENKTLKITINNLTIKNINFLKFTIF